MITLAPPRRVRAWGMWRECWAFQTPMSSNLVAFATNGIYLPSHHPDECGIRPFKVGQAIKPTPPRRVKAWGMWRECWAFSAPLSGNHAAFITNSLSGLQSTVDCNSSREPHSKWILTWVWGREDYMHIERSTIRRWSSPFPGWWLAASSGVAMLACIYTGSLIDIFVCQPGHRASKCCLLFYPAH